MKNALENLDELAKGEQNQLMVVLVAVAILLAIIAILKRKQFINIILFILLTFDGNRPMHHPSYKDRYDGTIK